MKNLIYDAVVIGTGLGGATFAYGLAKRGMKVCVIEQGDFLKPGGDPSPVHMSRFNGSGQAGGLTKFFGAAMPRFREMDFRATEMEAGVSPAWPISYADLLETMEQFARHRFDSHASPEAIGAQIRNTARLAINKAEDGK